MRVSWYYFAGPVRLFTPCRFPEQQPLGRSSVFVYPNGWRGPVFGQPSLACLTFVVWLSCVLRAFSRGPSGGTGVFSLDSPRCTQVQTLGRMERLYRSSQRQDKISVYCTETDHFRESRGADGSFIGPWGSEIFVRIIPSVSSTVLVTNYSNWQLTNICWGSHFTVAYL